jgi:antitoxin MazE
METNIQKWGNSLGVRLPKALAEKHALTEGVAVEVREGEKGLVIHVVERTKKPTLSELIKKITPENQHGETVWGSAVGNEVW